jgi:inosine-uridine nucleoside N-ribohydrolase
LAETERPCKIRMMLNKTYWLDLELREDIDDYLTLVYALEQGIDIAAVSIHNPSENELKLLAYTLSLFDAQTSIVLAGEITSYEQDKDIHHSLMTKITSVPLPSPTPLIEKMASFDQAPTPTVFCGGSLYTLSKISQCNTHLTLHACIQGGYAGPAVVSDEHVLKKFKGRERVPTWNLNLDLASTQSVLRSGNVVASFVSKNVCHDAWVDKQDVSAVDSVFNQTLTDYFSASKSRKKCMHDLLAFMTLHNPSLVSFSPVTLQHTDDVRPKWFSVSDPSSNMQISVSFDKPKFTHLIQDYKPKVQLENSRPKNENNDIFENTKCHEQKIRR